MSVEDRKSAQEEKIGHVPFWHSRAKHEHFFWLSFFAYRWRYRALTAVIIELFCFFAKPAEYANF